MSEPSSPFNKSKSAMPRSQSSGTLRKSGETAIANMGTGVQGESPAPAIPKHLSVNSLTRRKKLSKSTGNLHGLMAEDYDALNWPLPKAFGQEKYAYSLIDLQAWAAQASPIRKGMAVRLTPNKQRLVDAFRRCGYRYDIQMDSMLGQEFIVQEVMEGNMIGLPAADGSGGTWYFPLSTVTKEDGRYIKDCASMSKRLVRLSYDHQIIDLEWRKTYKALLDAEHRQSTLPANCQEKTKSLLKKEVDGHMKYLLELQEQKDMYDQNVKEVYEKCDSIKASIKKETDLEDLRMTMEKQTKDKIPSDGAFWKTKFNTHSPHHQRSSLALDH